MDYLQLLVTQLQNQNPLEPIDNNEMASQLAQLAQLEQLENLNGSFQKVLAAAQVSQAAALVGKKIAFYLPEDGSLAGGTVDRVVFEDGQARLMVADRAVSFENIVSVEN